MTSDGVQQQVWRLGKAEGYIFGRLGKHKPIHMLLGGWPPYVFCSLKITLDYTRTPGPATCKNCLRVLANEKREAVPLPPQKGKG